MLSVAVDQSCSDDNGLKYITLCAFFAEDIVFSHNGALVHMRITSHNSNGVCLC